MNRPEPTLWDTNRDHDDDDSEKEIRKINDEDANKNMSTRIIEGGEDRQHLPIDHTNDESLELRDTPRSGGETENASADRNLGSEAILYLIESYGAIVAPVSITMILSASAVVNFNTEETLEAGEHAYAKTYQVISLEEGDSTQNVGASLANTLVIVCVFCAITFVIVFLYKYRCLKIIYVYMVIVTAVLLGYLTSNMFLVAIDIYGWRVDTLSFALVMYNYATVGTLAIFYQRGIPRWITQGYLITSSVCLAWQLSYFNDWMAWTLLVVLALYDLFAVLSPCGPLKALANMISQPGAPQLPGLLYEASLPDGVRKPNEKPSTGSLEMTQRSSLPLAATLNRSQSYAENMGDENYENHENHSTKPQTTINYSTNAENGLSASISETRQSKLRESQTPQPLEDSDQQCTNRNRLHNRDVTEIPQNMDCSNTGPVPLVLTRIYKLDVLDTKGVLRQSRFAHSWQHYYSAEEIRRGLWTPKQLKSEVTAIFPSRGGTILKAREQKHAIGVTYIVYNRSGDEVRKFVVAHDGTLKQVLRRDTQSNGQGGMAWKGVDSIKLGIGDFVFYSVLVSKAAQYSFTTFTTCFVVVLSGLAATLVILAQTGKALPALPISVGLGVLVFLGTKELIQPWIHDVLRQNFYV